MALRVSVHIIVMLAMPSLAAAGAELSGNSVPPDAADEREQARFLIEPIFDLLDCGDEGYVQAGEVDEHLGELHRALGMARQYHENVNPGLSDTERNDLIRIESALRDDMDADGDDYVTKLEYRVRLIHLIHASDVDGDGEVTRDELHARVDASE